VCGWVRGSRPPWRRRHRIVAFHSISQILREAGQIVGAYFAPAQGGAAFTSPAVAETLDALQRQGAKGMGQSSWGPTGFAFAADAAEAQRLCDHLRAKANALGVDIAICKRLNRGAVVKGQPSTTDHS